MSFLSLINLKMLVVNKEPIGISFDEPPSFKDVLLDDIEQKIYFKSFGRTTNKTTIGVIPYEFYELSELEI